MERGQRSGWGNKFKRPDKQVKQQEQQKQQQQGGIEHSGRNQGQEQKQQGHCQPGAERVNERIVSERSSSDPRLDSSAHNATAVAQVMSPSGGEPKEDERRIRLSFAAPHR